MLKSLLRKPFHQINRNKVRLITNLSTEAHKMDTKRQRTTTINKEESLKFANEFVDFLNESCSAFHSTESCKKNLKKAGFTQISEKDEWKLSPGGKYFFSRNDSSVIAFTVGSSVLQKFNGFTIVGAHTDSPCLKVKPTTCFKKGNALMLNTQPYGGGLWHTWFDRDLGLAGRAIHKTGDGSIATKLFRINDPVARVPNLAIHLKTAAEREAFSPNLHTQGCAILSMDPEFMDATATEEEEYVCKRIHPSLLRMVAKEINVKPADIEDLEMQLIDVQPSCLGGATQDMLYSGRLDNLCSTYQTLRALIDHSEDLANAAASEQSNIKMAILFDHEEIGSNSCQGAGSSMFMDTVKRIHESVFGSVAHGDLMRALRSSYVVSIDMAHAYHPNYMEKHDPQMAPLINGGLVIKHNANQRYATNSISATLFRRLGQIANVPVQEFTVRSDSGCGSTIGPIIATLSGILTVDCGTPQFSMHSIRECMGSHDAYTGYLHLKAAYEHHPRLAASIDSIQV